VRLRKDRACHGSRYGAATDSRRSDRQDSAYPAEEQASALRYVGEGCTCRVSRDSQVSIEAARFGYRATTTRRPERTRPPFERGEPKRCSARWLMGRCVSTPTDTLCRAAVRRSRCIFPMLGWRLASSCPIMCIPPSSSVTNLNNLVARRTGAASSSDARSTDRSPRSSDHSSPR